MMGSKLSKRTASLKRNLVAVGLAWLAATTPSYSEPLPPLPNMDVSSITVSGLSAGGAMAQQIGVAFSDRVSGVAVIAGPPYLCAPLGAVFAVMQCSQFADRWFEQNAPVLGQVSGDPKKPNVEGWIDGAKKFERLGWIAPTANIRKQRVWLMRGLEDKLGPGRRTFAATAKFYKHFGVRPEWIRQPKMHHTMPTTESDYPSCELPAAPDYLSSCGFSAAEKMLAFLYPGLQEASSHAGRLIAFDQAPYTVRCSDDATTCRNVKPSDIGMARTGWVFVPDACLAGAACKLHVALHGCSQGDDLVSKTPGHRFVEKAGYNPWAAKHNLVVLYPQTDIETQQGVTWENEFGCWDWWGETSAPPERLGKYATRYGSQPRSVMNMVDALRPDRGIPGR